jgi:hypothetical protein
MAEERNLATARAPEAAAGEVETVDPTKAELQRRMDEARESITNTVHEIKETVTNQYQNVRESISQQLDWREQYRSRPVAFTVGALGVGALVGYSLGGALFGSEDDLADRYYEAEGEGDYEDSRGSVRADRSYAGQAITGGAYGSTSYAAASPARASADTASQAFERGFERQQREVGEAYGDSRRAEGRATQAAPLAAVGSSDSRPSYSSGYESSPAAPAAAEPSGPGLLERFKETQAYDRLQQEVQTLGSRAVEELSKTAQQVVLPALLNKLKDLIGIDLSTQREVAQRSKLEHQAVSTRAQAAQADQSAQTGAEAGGTSAYSAGYGKNL